MGRTKTSMREQHEKRCGDESQLRGHTLLPLDQEVPQTTQRDGNDDDCEQRPPHRDGVDELAVRTGNGPLSADVTTSPTRTRGACAIV